MHYLFENLCKRIEPNRVPLTAEKTDDEDEGSHCYQDVAELFNHSCIGSIILKIIQFSSNPT